MKLPYVEALQHVEQHPEQKTMHNGYQRCTNVMGKFSIAQKPYTTPVLLIDDLADSRWTLAIASDLLLRNGSGVVYPFAIASTNLE